MNVLPTFRPMTHFLISKIEEKLLAILSMHSFDTSPVIPSTRAKRRAELRRLHALMKTDRRKVRSL